MTMTAGDLWWIGQQLRILQDNTGLTKDAARAHANQLANGVTTIEGTAEGPRVHAAVIALTDYATAIGEAPGILESIESTLGSWATVAESLYEDWINANARIAEIQAGIYQMSPDGAERALRVQNNNIEEIKSTWSRTCADMAETMHGDTTELQRASIYAVGPGDIPTGAEFAGVVSWSLATRWHGVTLTDIDPTGQLQEQADELLDDIIEGGGNPLITLVLDFANSQQASDADGHVSWDDILAATADIPTVDPNNVLDLVEKFAAAHPNLNLTEQQKADLAAEVINAAWLLRAGDGTETALNSGPTAPTTSDIDMAAVEEAKENIDLSKFNGFGACAEAAGDLGPIPVALEAGGCVVTTDKNTGLIVFTGGGAGTGSPNASAAGGAIITNAQDVNDLGGYAVNYTVGAGSGLGGSGTVSIGVERGPNGIWHPNGIYAVQLNASATTPDVSAAGTVVSTKVVFTNGTLNVIREPVEFAVSGADQVIDNIIEAANVPRGLWEFGQQMKP